MKYIGIDYLKSNDRIAMINKNCILYSFIQRCTARFIHGIQIRVEYLMGMIMTCEPSKKVAPNFTKTFRVKF